MQETLSEHIIKSLCKFIQETVQISSVFHKVVQIDYGGNMIEEASRRFQKEREESRRIQEALDNCKHSYIYYIRAAGTGEAHWYCSYCDRFLGYKRPPYGEIVDPPGIDWDEP